MAKALRRLGTLLIVAGLAVAAWALVVWRWEDPFTSLYTAWKQRGLEASYQQLVRDYRPARPRGASLAAERATVAAEARAFRRQARPGQAIGRIVVRRIGVDMIVVNGTDHDSLTKGPGRDPRTYMPGQNRLVYIAGHRTTYAAPFAHIDSIRPGDRIRLELPYATFVYRAFTHRIVRATNLSVLRSPRHELLELQACHPRFFASHRYIVYGRLMRVLPRGGTPYTPAQVAAAAES